MPTSPRRRTGARAVLAAGLCLGLHLAGAGGAASAATIDFTSADDSGTAYFGNSLAFAAGGIGVTAAAWAETGAAWPAGSGYYRFEEAEVHSWTLGLGVCNASEGNANVTCDDNEHELDTAGRDELLVLYFDQPVNFESLVVNSFDGSGSDPNDRDVVYWVGSVAALPDLTGQTFATLGGIAGLGAETLSAAPSGYGLYTHALSGTGNLLLIAGNYRDRACTNADVTADIECEAYKIVSVTASAVPLPAVSWLLVPAFAVAGLAGRRQSRR